MTSPIESAEQRFKQILEDFFISVYDEKALPSHGIDHHRRVWGYAKDLIFSLEKQSVIIDPALPGILIIACYLHDIGMSVDPGIKHGHHSKNLCREFLRKNQLSENNYLNLLSAIENHDNKEYKTSSGKYDLLTILSVADDLDAFGFVGIYRYSEIYLTRGIVPEELGYLINKNAEQRFDNFVKTFGAIEDICQRHRERYNILNEFFDRYKEQVQTYKFKSGHPEGYCGVIEILLKMITNKKELKEIYPEVENSSDDQVINWFFDGLRLEL